MAYLVAIFGTFLAFRFGREYEKDHQFRMMRKKRKEAVAKLPKAVKR
jgi:hypothetical protein